MVTRPAGIIAYDLRSTQSRQALHTVVLVQADPLPAQPGIQTPRADILPFIGRTAVGVYAFEITPYLTDQTRWIGISCVAPAGTPPFLVFVDPTTDPTQMRFLTYDLAGAPVDLVQGQGFALSIAVRDS